MSDDRELFKDTAWYYSQYRRGYPEAFFTYLIDRFRLDQTSRVLDLGTGTGQIAIPLAPRVRSVVAIDPEKEMINEGKRIAEKKDISNITWLESKAEDLPDNLGTFDVTTVGAAFHWMDREKVLKKIYDLTNEGGGVVIVSDSGKKSGPQHGENWKEVRHNIIKKYLGERRRAGNSFFERGDDTFEDRLTNSPFKGYELWTHQIERVWTMDEVVNFLYSTSFASKRLFGDKLNKFEDELRKELLKLEPSGVFKEEVQIEALIGQKTSSAHN